MMCVCVCVCVCVCKEDNEKTNKQTKKHQMSSYLSNVNNTNKSGYVIPINGMSKKLDDTKDTVWSSFTLYYKKQRRF